MVLIQPASSLLPALTLLCKPSSIYCAEAVALEKFLHLTEKTRKTAGDCSVVSKRQEFRVLSCNYRGRDPGALPPGVAGDSTGPKVPGLLKHVF